MRLTKIYKDPASANSGCPTVYVGENGDLVVQGKRIDADTFSHLESVAPGETAVRISPEVLLRAVEYYKANHSL